MALLTKPGRDLSTSIGTGLKGVDRDQPILELSGISLKFSGLIALQEVSFGVNPDELFAIIGPNGAGKTSIFNCISGVYRPHVGSITMLSSDLIGKRPHEIAGLGVARTFQNIELFTNLTLLDNILLGRHQHLRYGTLSAMPFFGRARRDESAHRQVVEEIVDFLEVQAFREYPVGMLPYGIQKRVELGRALAMEPKILLLDEPVAGMNREETEDMARFILDIREELDIAVILVEHDMGLVMDIADRVLVLDFGRMVALDVPERIQNHPDVIRAYLGEQHGTSAASAGGEG